MKEKTFLSMLVMGGMLATAMVLAAQTPDSAKVTALLEHSKVHAVQASHDAEQIESYTRSKLSWRSHASQLNVMKENVNALGKDVAELATARDEASPWQREAIDNIDPLLRSLADHMTAMINHLNDNVSEVHMPPYVEYARANYDLSEKLAATIRDYVDYAEAKARTEALENKLSLAVEPSPGEQ